MWQILLVMLVAIPGMDNMATEDLLNLKGKAEKWNRRY